MLNQIVDALHKRSDLVGWTVREVQSREAQVYAVPQGIESQRKVDGEKYRIDVMRDTSTADGSPAMGSGDASLLPGEDIDQAINQAALVAGLVSNPVHGLPGPAEFPKVPLCDEQTAEKFHGSHAGCHGANSDCSIESGRGAADSGRMFW